ncbi:MAG TPA: hypothetical protein VLL76_10305, partial [Candidatus Omnitrophota bacterium]|nr:hypothetical protein [Candidatus Omnitrophota bacterium]
LALAALLAAAPALAQHENHGAPPPSPNGWTTLPIVEARLKGRMGVELSAPNGAARTMVVTPPKGEKATLDAPGGKASFKPVDGNYHLVTAVDACDVHVATATTAVYFPNPGAAPTKILKQPAEGLTVVPDKLPREHASYRAGETWVFHVAKDGQPFPGAKVRLETGNGTKAELVSDMEGKVAVTFPEDFPPRDQRPPEAHGRPLQSPFVVAAIVQTGSLQHIGAFNHVYRPGAYDGMSVWAGAGFGLVGMALAAPFVRRRRTGAAP